MKPLISLEAIENSKSRDLIPFECGLCHSTFYRTKKMYGDALSPKRNDRIDFCSQRCNQRSRSKEEARICKQCNKPIIKKKAELLKSKSGHSFCSNSCAGVYWSRNKATGTTRSKLEKWIEQQLTLRYPSLTIDYNKTNAIKAELDIFIPSLSLAFELNGIFHYEPIFGDKKLNNIKNNDQRKFKACSDAGISLCVLDTSQQKYFKTKTSEKYLEIIVKIIEDSVGLVGGSNR